jgi:hypothetical protein
VEKVMRFFLILTFCIPVLGGFAQDIIRPGLISARLTISPSRMLSNSQSHFYLHGNLEGYLTERLSLSGEGYYYLGSLSSESDFNFNHSGFFGASWHFLKKNNDLYVGIQPGIAITQLSESVSGDTPTDTGVNPLFSAVVGYNLFVNRAFHFFLQTRIIAGQHNVDVHKDLAEFRFSAGLGFNLNAVK